jgi:hypothetical protein
MPYTLTADTRQTHVAEWSRILRGKAIFLWNSSLPPGKLEDVVDQADQ